MKKTSLCLVFLLLTEFILKGISLPQLDLDQKENLCFIEKINIGNKISEKDKKIQLYISAMKYAYGVENGGVGFIAIEKSTLVELDNKSKEEVLKGFKNLVKNIYWYEDVKDNSELFVYDDHGMLSHTINGTLLSVNLERYNENEAIIEATSLFGNLGAVVLRYQAIYKDEEWKLKVLTFGKA